VAQRRRHVGVAQHARQLAPPRLSARHLHVARRDTARRALRYHQMMIRVGRDLRQVGDDQRLPLPSRTRHDVLERLAHSHPGLAPDSLIDLVKHERRHRVVGREHHLEGEHQS